MVDEKTPQYCSVCGTRLIPGAKIQGYDPFTGFSVNEETLRCPNPTVVSNRLSTSKTHHPSWFNDNGAWVQN